MDSGTDTRAFLYARGLDVNPEELAADVQDAVAVIHALYDAYPGEDGRPG